MRRSIVPALAVLLCAPAAYAKPLGCTVVFDDVRDVRPVADLPYVDPRVNESYPHLDVTWGSVEWSRGQLIARIYVLDTQPIADGRRGAWVLGFVVRGQQAVVLARTGDLADPATAIAPVTFYAGVDRGDGALARIPGRLLNGYLEMTVPPLAFGAPALRPGDLLSGFRMESYERMPAAAVTIGDEPDGQRTGTYAGPGRCRMPG